MPWKPDDDFGPEDEYSGFDTGSDDDDATLPCPDCGAVIYESADRCPKCGHHISPGRAWRERKPWWLVAGVVLCLLIVLSWAFGAGVILLW